MIKFSLRSDLLLICTNPGSFVLRWGSMGVPPQPPGDGNIFGDNFRGRIFPLQCHGCWWSTPVDPRLGTKDPGFVRIRSRSDRSEICIKTYLKTKKLERFPYHSNFFVEWQRVFTKSHIIFSILTNWFVYITQSTFQ